MQIPNYKLEWGGGFGLVTLVDEVPNIGLNSLVKPVRNARLATRQFPLSVLNSKYKVKVSLQNCSIRCAILSKPLMRPYHYQDREYPCKLSKHQDETVFDSGWVSAEMA